MKFVEEVHNCPAVWDVPSEVYRDAKNGQNKMEELADRLGSFELLSTSFWHFRFLSSLLPTSFPGSLILPPPGALLGALQGRVR